MDALNYLNVSIMLSYLVATLCMLAGIIKRNHAILHFSLGLTLLGFAAHSLMLGTGLFGLSWAEISKSEYMQLLSWSVLLIYLLLCWRMRIVYLSVTASPLALLLFILALHTRSAQALFPASLKGLFFGLHVGSLFLSLSLIAIAFGAALIFLHLNKKIKNKDKVSGFLKDFPSLNVFDRINHIAVLVGFPLYTLGLASGFIWAQITWGKALSGDPKELVSLVIWFMFAYLFCRRVAFGERGRKAAKLIIYMFLLTIFSLVVVNFFMPTHHSFTA